jgi:hypothetical protein
MADSSGVSFNIGCVKSRCYGPIALPPYQTTVRCSLFDLRKLLLQFRLRKNLKSELPLPRYNPLGHPDSIEIPNRLLTILLVDSSWRAHDSASPG